MNENRELVAKTCVGSLVILFYGNVNSSDLNPAHGVLDALLIEKRNNALRTNTEKAFVDFLMSNDTNGVIRGSFDLVSRDAHSCSKIHEGQFTNDELFAFLSKIDFLVHELGENVNYLGEKAAAVLSVLVGELWGSILYDHNNEFERAVDLLYLGLTTSKTDKNNLFTKYSGLFKQ